MRSIQQKEAYEFCKKNGICVTEGCSNLSDGKVRCPDCRNLYRKRKKIYNRDNAILNAERWQKYYNNNKEKEISRKGVYAKLRTEQGLSFPSQRHNSDKYQKRKYGLTARDRTALLELQEYSCSICLEPFLVGKEIHTDHDHETNKVRGLTHPVCNTGIGMFGDSVQRLYHAIEYLERTSTYEAFILGR